MIWHILNWAFKSLALLPASLMMTLIGYPVTAIALLFRVEHPKTDKPFTQFRGMHRLVTLPSWALPWDNIFDGAWGDERGWWDNECRSVGSTCQSFFSMWWWMAVRNSANHFSRVTTSCDAGRCVITKLAGDDEVLQEPGKRTWNFLVATRDDGTQYHRLHAMLAYPRSRHAFEVNIGWKIDLSDRGILPFDPPDERLIGSVFRIRPWVAVS